MTFGRTLSPAATASMNAEETDEVWLVLLTITHPNITDPADHKLRLVNDVQDLIRTEAGSPVTYIGYPFEIDLPGEDQDSSSVARIRIDNVDRMIVQAIRGLPSPPTASIEVVLASQPDTVEVAFYDLTLRAVAYDAVVVEGELQMEQIVTEPLCASMSPDRFPGMF